MCSHSNVGLSWYVYGCVMHWSQSMDKWVRDRSAYRFSLSHSMFMAFYTTTTMKRRRKKRRNTTFNCVPNTISIESKTLRICTVERLKTIKLCLFVYNFLYFFLYWVMKLLRSLSLSIFSTINVRTYLCLYCVYEHVEHWYEWMKHKIILVYARILKQTESSQRPRELKSSVRANAREKQNNIIWTVAEMETLKMV